MGVGALSARTGGVVPNPITEQITDPNSELVREALTRTCHQCLAGIGCLCVKRDWLQADLLGRVIHLDRIGP